MEEMKYYRFERGNVLVRRCGTKVEKKGADGVWRSAPELLIRFLTGDLSLIELEDWEIPPEDAPSPEEDTAEKAED